MARYDKKGNGRFCAVTARRLCKITGLCERSLRHVILSMILKGYNVGSSNRNNYFLVISYNDEKEAVLPELKRMKTIFKRITMTRKNRMHKMSNKLVRTTK